jgi:hypothetical protein
MYYTQSEIILSSFINSAPDQAYPVFMLPVARVNALHFSPGLTPAAIYSTPLRGSTRKSAVSNLAQDWCSTPSCEMDTSPGSGKAEAGF